MPTPRDTAIAAATTLIDALIAATLPVPVPVPVPVPPPTTPPPGVPVPPIVPATGHPRIMLGSQAARLKAALTGPAGVRWLAACDSWVNGGDLWGFAAWNGALASQLTGNPKYAAKAVAMVDAQVTGAEARIAAGQAPEVAGDSYLQIGEMIGDLALVYDWCSGQLTGAQRARWIAYANQAVANVWHPTSASWGGKTMAWTGWAVDDPGNNYFYSFTRATMLLGLATQGENPQAATWIAKFRERIVGRLVPYMTANQADGGSREGTGYGVALRNLFELYAIWQWSTGENLADLTPHTRASLLTMASQIVPTLDRKAPIGDQSRDSTAALFDYERHCLLELAALYPTAPESAGVAALLAQSSVSSMGSGFMLAQDVVYAPAAAPAAIGLPLVRYAAGIGEINARTAWDKGATWLSLICGPFTQGHAHEDQGSLMLYKGGWLAYDAVIDSRGGVRQSGSLVGTTACHSLVRIDDANGAPVPQREGGTSKVLALQSGPGYLFAALDLTPAYGGSALVQLVRRQVLWLQPDVVLVQDHVVSSPGTAQTWQLVVPVAPGISGATALFTVGAHTLRATRITPAAVPWTAFDFRSNSDFAGGWRADCRQSGGDRVYLTVLAIDGATSPATSTVQFADVGCSFTLGGKQITLGPGIDAP
jgi:hypothetical protein